MKILVMSDSHGKVGLLEDIINDNMNADIIAFLGDGERDFFRAMRDCRVPDDKEIWQVQGNCDPLSREEVTLIKEAAGIRFYVTHGFEQAVKWGLEKLSYKAEEQGCQIALFGHTHSRHLSNNGGVFLFNPGSAVSGSYGVINIVNGQLDITFGQIDF